MGMNSPKILICMETYQLYIEDESDEKLLAIAIEAWDLVASKLMGGMVFLCFLWGLIHTFM